MAMFQPSISKNENSKSTPLSASRPEANLRSAGKALGQIIAVEPIGAVADDQLRHWYGRRLNGIGADERFADGADRFQMMHSAEAVHRGQSTRLTAARSGAVRAPGGAAVEGGGESSPLAASQRLASGSSCPPG